VLRLWVRRRSGRVTAAETGTSVPKDPQPESKEPQTAISGRTPLPTEEDGRDGVLLRPRGPLNLALTLETGQAFRWRQEDEWYRGVVGRNIWKVRQMSRALEIRSGPEPASLVAGEARSYFRLDDDLGAIYRELGRDERVARAIRKYRGLRLVRQDPWECMVSFIISAYSNVKRITKHIEDLSLAYGDPVTFEGVTRHTFPSPARLAELGEQDFRDMGLGYRSKSLARLARDLLDRGLDLHSLRSAPYTEAKESLLTIHGIGDKVADCILLFSLDKLEAFPVDVWVRRAVTEWYFPDQKVTDRTVRLWAAEHFGGHAGYAQQYLFHQRRLQQQAERGRMPPLKV